jgi:RNA recognition motif-containing protein
MTTKLFVAGIPYKNAGGQSFTDTELQDHFSQCGTVVSAKIIRDRDTGLSRGFGFVEMATAEEAQKAIDMLNNQPLEGRLISVRFSEEKPAGERTGGGMGGRGGDRRDGGNAGGGFQRRSFAPRTNRF